MPFPDTPKTVIDRLKRHDMPRSWESAWEEFFDLYHLPTRILVRAAFRRAGWISFAEQDVEDVVIEVFTSLIRGQETFELKPEKGRFRQFLTSLCHRRTVDFIRRHQRRGLHDSFETDKVPQLAADPDRRLEAEEDEAFRAALVATLLSSLRREVSPQVFLIFELVKLNGHDAAEVAAQLGVKRGVVDNSVYKALQKLRQIAADETFTADFTEPSNPDLFSIL